MKKYFLSLLMITILSAPALAGADDHNRKGSGFPDPNAPVQTVAAPAGGGYTGPSDNMAGNVAEALKARDDARVHLVGKIDKHLGGDQYQFSDSSGSITLEIDDDHWRGLSAGPNDMVEIWGEVDKSLTSAAKIEVDRISRR